MKTVTCINPATEEVCGIYPLIEEMELDALIKESSKVQAKWSYSDLTLRKQLFLNLAALLVEKKSYCATLITSEMGKPISQSLAEIEKCALLCEFYAQEGQAFLEPELIKTDFYKSYRTFEPIGIIFGIMPWNFPFWQVMRFAIPNIMAGNGVLLKHAPNCFGTAVVIEELFIKAGFPIGLFRSALVDVDLSPFIIHHPKIAAVTLTGSPLAGKAVAQEAGSALKKVVLELGGNDPYLILKDANLKLAAEQCVKSRLNNCGQVCIAAKRFIVVKEVQKEFESLVFEAVKKYKSGDPKEDTTTLGPMARQDLRLHLHEQVQRAIAQGARCVAGGQLPLGPGFYYPITILLDVKPSSKAFEEELFGPVICITPAKDEAHAIELANQSEYGLAAAVFTEDKNRGEAIARKLNVGTCAVNTLVSSHPKLPFGGIKNSGFGRELSVEGMREFMNIKSVIVA